MLTFGILRDKDTGACILIRNCFLDKDWCWTFKMDGCWISWFCCKADWMFEFCFCSTALNPSVKALWSVRFKRADVIVLKPAECLSSVLFYTPYSAVNWNSLWTWILSYVSWSEMFPGQGLMVNILRDGYRQSWFCCIALCDIESVRKGSLIRSFNWANVIVFKPTEC
jgi:hypothetical protein